MSTATVSLAGVSGPRVVAMSPPGRFPTTVRDPGGWWRTLAVEGTQLVGWSANAAWWGHLCSRHGVEALMGTGGPPTQRLGRSRAVHAALKASAGLEALTRAATFESADSYADAVALVVQYLRMLDRSVPGWTFPLGAGLEIAPSVYPSSAELVATARTAGPLARLADLVAGDYPTREVGTPPDVILVTVSSPEDLLLAMAVIEGLHRRGASFHACLADHGWENFTLRPHLARLRDAKTLDTVFDTIVEAKDERDVIVPALVRALAAGASPKGYLTSESSSLTAFLAPPLQGAAVSPLRSPLVPPPVPTFAPEPVLATRLSSRRCYWARCTFCIHNEKYDDVRVPSTAEVPAAVDAIEGWLAAGYRIVNLNDEALSPAILSALCTELERRATATRFPGFRWICRSKLELSFDLPLFRRMRATGCFEILFGLESASARVRGLMDKHVPGMDRDEVLRIVRAATDAGIALHLNVIAGFPGETIEELVDTMFFLGTALSGMPLATYLVNEFAVFPATPVAREPARFGIELLDLPGDMVALIPHRATAEWAREASTIHRQLPDLQAELDSSLGWSGFRDEPDRDAAMRLYVGTGHGTLLKANGIDLRTIRPGREAVA
jgi:Radical SAM superfamily